MSISGSLILEYIAKPAAEYINAAGGFEFPSDASVTESGHIRIHYLNDENFLFADENGFFLNGEPTDQIGALIENLEKINKSNWGHAVSDETILDAKDVRTGFDRVFTTEHDVSGTTNVDVRCGVGSGDDLSMVRLVTFDPAEAIGPGMFTISGELLSGVLREQRIDYNNIYNFAPEIEQGYLYLNSGEIYLYGSKVTELHPDHDLISGVTVSGTPNDFAPIMIRIADLPSLSLGCHDGDITDSLYYESDQYQDHYLDEWHNNLSPASPFYKVDINEIARVYVDDYEIVEREMTTQDIAVDYFMNSGVAHARTAGDMSIVYGENDIDTCVFPDVDLSPLTWEDGDRLFAIQPFEKDPYSVSAQLTQGVVQPVVTTQIVSGDTNIITAIANVRDEDGAPLSGEVVLFDLGIVLQDISGTTLGSTQSLDEYLVPSPPVGNIVRSIEHKFVLDSAYSGTVFNEFDNGLFDATTVVVTYAIPARAYMDDGDPSGQIFLQRYVETDQFGSAPCSIRVHNFNNYSTENKLHVSVSGHPTVTNDANFRILSVGTSIDGYSQNMGDGYFAPNVIKECQYVDFSGATEVDLSSYPYGGEQMVRLHSSADYFASWGPGGTLTEPAVSDRGSDLWYDGNGAAHVLFSTAMSGGYVCWERMLSHTSDLIGTNYV